MKDSLMSVPCPLPPLTYELHGWEGTGGRDGELPLHLPGPPTLLSQARTHAAGAGPRH